MHCTNCGRLDLLLDNSIRVSLLFFGLLSDKYACTVPPPISRKLQLLSTLDDLLLSLFGKEEKQEVASWPSSAQNRVVKLLGIWTGSGFIRLKDGHYLIPSLIVRGHFLLHFAQFFCSWASPAHIFTFLRNVRQTSNGHKTSRWGQDHDNKMMRRQLKKPDYPWQMAMFRWGTTHIKVQRPHKSQIRKVI